MILTRYLSFQSPNFSVNRYVNTAIHLTSLTLPGDSPDPLDDIPRLPPPLPRLPLQVNAIPPQASLPLRQPPVSTPLSHQDIPHQASLPPLPLSVVRCVV